MVIDALFLFCVVAHSRIGFQRLIRVSSEGFDGPFRVLLFRAQSERSIEVFECLMGVSHRAFFVWSKLKT